MLILGTLHSMLSGLRQVIPPHKKQNLNYFFLGQTKIFFSTACLICKIYFAYQVIYLADNIVNKMTELTRTINNVNELSMAQSDITSLQESVNNNTTNILTLESYTVLHGTNFGVGPGVLGNLTGTQNTVVGNWEDALPYTITSGSNNTFIGYNTGKSCEQGSNNTFVGNNIQLTPGQSLFTGSIGLGSGVVINNSDQFVVASNVTSFIIPGLTASTGTGEGTILEFDSSGYIIPSAGTYNTVSKIDTAISALQNNSSVSTSGPFVPTFSSEVNCTAASVNLGFSYYGEDFYNLYMVFTVDVTGLSVSSFSFNVSGIPGEYNTDFTPTAIVSVSGSTSLYHNVTWSFSTGSATISLSFTSSTTNEGYYVPSGTYTV